MTQPAPKRVTEHVAWLPPAAPDRPSLATVMGREQTLMLDIGASPAHTRHFLDGLEAEGLPLPTLAVLSHWHWDHVFGMGALEIPILAHERTARQLDVLRSYDWRDEALDARVQSGEEAEMYARDIKLELPRPREVALRTPDVVFEDGLELQLGGVACHILHVGGDHAADSCIVHVEPDELVFLGDCLYDAIYAPERYYTWTTIFPLFEKVLNLNAELYIAGHGDTVMTRKELTGWQEQFQHAYEVASRSDIYEKREGDENFANLVQLFIAGQRHLEKSGWQFADL